MLGVVQKPFSFHQSRNNNILEEIQFTTGINNLFEETMGGGVSAPSVNRLRKTIVIRAYNLRKKDETLDEQLRPFATRSPSTNKLSLSLLDVKSSLQLEDGSLWTSIESLLVHCVGPAVRLDGIDYDIFIAFLQDGKMPLQTLSSSASAGNILRKETELETATVRTKSTLPSPPPPSTVRKPDLRVETFGDNDPPHVSSSSPEDCTEAIASPHPYLVEPADSPQQQTEGQQAFFAAEQKAEVNALIINGRGPRGSAMQTQSGKPLWKKKETTKVERTIEYTTIDADGVLQELLEQEITETEILHMECKETGEFAHRETTEFQQKEVFNKEIVSEQIGTEEYVHLKSMDDEIEYMDSTMPQKQAQEPERGRGGEDVERDMTATEADGTAEGGTYDSEETYQEYLYRQAMANAQAEAAAAAAEMAGNGDCDGLDDEEGNSFPRVRNPTPIVRPAPPRRPPQNTNRGCYSDFDDDEYAQECPSSSCGHGRKLDGSGPSTPIRDPHSAAELCSDGSHDEYGTVGDQRSGFPNIDPDADIDDQQQRHRQRMHLFEPPSPLSSPSKLCADGTNGMDSADDNSRLKVEATQQDAAPTEGSNDSNRRGSMMDID